MIEHVKKILNYKLIYGVHMAVYLLITLVNIDTIFDQQVRQMGYSITVSITFTCLFVLLAFLESCSYFGEGHFLEKRPGALIYRIVRIIIVMAYYFSLPRQLGTGLCVAVILLFFAELLFYFPMDERPRRILMYLLMAIPMEIITVFRMTVSDTLYRATEFFVTANLMMLTVIIVCELVSRTFSHFLKLLFEQNWTVDTLHDANEKLKVQQEQIKKTNEMLGVQKIELQTANKKINRAHDEMSVQNEVASAITSSTQMEELMSKVCRIIRIRLDLDFVGVVLEPDETIQIPGRKPGRQELYMSTVFDETWENQMEYLLMSGQASDLLALSQTYIQNTETNVTCFEFKGERKDKLQSLVIVPLHKKNARLGSFIMGKRNINAFMDSRAFHENIAGQLSIGISNIRLYEQMHEIAIRDGLTRIYNRRHLSKILNEYLANAMQKKSVVSLALFDIDKFKMVNDTYGHPCGDVVICHVAELLNQAAEDNGGIAGRYGGEEFVIAFEGKNLAEVYDIVETVHRRIKTEPVIFDKQKLTVCASAGVASYPETCKNPSELLTRADWAMYHSKRNGRDRITIDSEDIENIM